MLCCLVLCLWLLCISRHKRAIEAARRELVRKRDRVRTAVLSMKRLNYPLCVMSLADFRKAGSMLFHEEAQTARLLRTLSTWEEAVAFGSSNPLVFVSHQWHAHAPPHAHRRAR